MDRHSPFRTGDERIDRNERDDREDLDDVQHRRRDPREAFAPDQAGLHDDPSFYSQRPRGSEGFWSPPSLAEPMRTSGAPPVVHEPMGPNRPRGPRNYKRSDARIYEDVCEALADEDAIDARDVEVRVEDGEVTLTGIVADREQKWRIEDLVSEVRGVTDVRNALKPLATSR